MVNQHKNKILAFFCLLSLLSPVIAMAVTCDSNLDGKTDAELQMISAQCDADLADLNAKASTTKQYSSQLQKGIADLNTQISKIQLQIKAKNATIKQLGDNIATTTQYIGQLSNRIDDINQSIAKMLREGHYMDDSSIVDVLLSDESLSNFFINADNYSTINQKLQDLIQELSGVKKTSEDQKKILQDKQAQESKLKYEQEQAQKQTQGLKTEQQTLLSLTKNKEAEYEQMIAEKERLKNQIRNKLYKTAGGEEITFGDALKIIQPYESAIGVDSALTLAVLFQESAVDSTIGKNIGQCYYNQASSCAYGKTVMSDAQMPTFLQIMGNLGLNPNITPISCPICRDGTYGGAMGPAQFMPVTWNAISSRVSNLIGIAYPSPFENKAAFTASALLLKDNQDRCQTAFSRQSDIWSCSAAKYYGGLLLSGTKLLNSMRYGYGHSVAVRAQQFESDIATLSL